MVRVGWRVSSGVNLNRYVDIVARVLEVDPEICMIQNDQCMYTLM